MTILVLMAGVFLAATLFGSVLWSGYAAFLGKGPVRLVNGGLCALTLATMAAMSFEVPWLSIGLGGFLALMALAGTAMNKGWSRLMSLPPAILGASLVTGLPFIPA